MDAAQFSVICDKVFITAYVDVLGWGELTPGGVTDALALIARGTDPNQLSFDHKEKLSAIQDRLGQAHEVDRSIQKIVDDLRNWTKLFPATTGPRSAVRFWANSHVVLVRVSDCIFLYSTSCSNVVTVVSELLKRGLEAGILVRAGLSLGSVEHVEHFSDEGIDPRARSISLFGDGITTAARTETLSRGAGTRAFIHPDLTMFVQEQLPEILGPGKGLTSGYSELKWWADLSALRDLQELTVWSPSKALDLIEALRSSPAFEWNRRSEKGARAVEDTISVLREAFLV